MPGPAREEPPVREPATEQADHERQYVLAVDLGTTGLKVGLVSLTGSIAATGGRHLETELSFGGGATQDAEMWWSAITELARSACKSKSVAPGQVVAVACTGQWASTVPVDASGHPVGPCLLWMDTRGAKRARELIGGPVAGYSPLKAITWIRRSGGVPSTTGSDPTGHRLYLANDAPDVYEAARWLLEPVDYLSMRFTGIAAATHASMTASWITDNRRLEHLEYDPRLVRLSKADPHKLPPLIATGSIVGPLDSAVGDSLGLHGGIPVVSATPDLHSSAVGSGAVGDFEAHMTISTTSWISCPVPFKKTDPIRQLASVPGLSPDRYLIANNHETAGRCLEWLRDTLFDEGVSFGELTDLAKRSVPGSAGVIFTPWLAGERSPIDDRFARGSIHNLGLGTTRADVVRAVLEGVALNARWLHDAVEKFAGQRLDPIRIVGGGAQSDLWCQIHADVMDRTIERVADPLHAGIRGAALFAGMALGKLHSRDIRSIVAVDTTFEPNPANREIYDRLYRELPRFYKAAKPMFARLNRPR